jgi:(p)ppGpp synthase/HD superfamily hydrolase
MKLYSPLINKAMQIAYDAHSGQTDKTGMPYIYHPAFLAGQMDTEDEIITALLHDVVEDTTVTFADLEREGFSQQVLDAIRLLTHDDGSEYADYVCRIKQNVLATKIKLADLRHNSNPTRSTNLPSEDTARFRDKYSEAIRLFEQQ